MEFMAQYQAYLALINRELEVLFEVPDLPQRSVFEAMRYGVMGGGKRIRPVLTLAVCDLLGGEIRDAVRLACAVECIHSYSLIHDDLPCMDDDDLRRGRPTCHKAFPENIALLAGDGLLNIAFELLSDTEQYIALGAEGAAAAIRILSGASGVYGMIGGQVMDLECENRTDVTLEELRSLHGKKTGMLIRAAAELGCIAAGHRDGTEETYQKVVAFADALGLAFQIKDDILDVVGSQKLLGKPVGSDEGNHKATFVSLLGLDGAKAALDTATKEAKAALDGTDGAEFLLDLADYLLNREV